MKKFLLLLLIAIIPLQAFAFEDYIITSDSPVKSVFSSDDSIVTALPFFTIDNNKDTILVKAKKEGAAEITVSLEDKYVVVKARVEADKTTLECEDEQLAIFPLDIPDEEKEVK